MARPTKLTPDVQNIIISAIERGHTYESACGLAGIHYDTFNEWRKRGNEEIERLKNPRCKLKEDEGPFVEFSEALTRAEAGMVENALLAIDMGALGDGARPGDWRAAAWKLERRKPDDWGQRSKIVHEFSTEELRILQQIKALLEQRQESPSDLFQDLLNELARDDVHTNP